jgi:hypothetical protein
VPSPDEELEFLAETLSSFLEGNFALFEPDEYLSRVDGAVRDSLNAASANLRISRLREAAVYASLGALATALAIRELTSPLNEAEYVLHAVGSQVELQGDVRAAAAEARAAISASKATEEHFIDIAAAAIRAIGELA